MPKLASVKINLTDERVAKSTTPKRGRVVIHDAKQPGLQLVITPNGCKTFYLRTRVKGRTLLGHAPTLTVGQARDRAKLAAAQIVEGKDPAAERRLIHNDLTLKDAFEHFKTNMQAKSRPSTQVSHTNRFETCLKSWENRRLLSIQSVEVANFHLRLGSKGKRTTANRAIQLLRSIFNHACKYIPGMKNLENPVVNIEWFKEHERETYLLPSQLPRFFKALSEEPNEMIRDFFNVLLFCGQRRGNVQSMKWDDVDLESATWRIPASSHKGHKMHTVVLTRPVLEILERRRQTRDSSDYVFPSWSGCGYLVEPKAAWKRLLKRANIKGVTIHDLRRTNASWQLATGANLQVIKEAMGHQRIETTMRYTRLQLDAVRSSMAAATTALEAAAKVDILSRHG